VAQVVPFAIGMADSIDDGDAINYAAQFYAAIANGRSINASHLSGQAALELARSTSGWSIRVRVHCVHVGQVLHSTARKPVPL
jgi:hypothetical protein